MSSWQSLQLYIRLIKYPVVYSKNFYGRSTSILESLKSTTNYAWDYVQQYLGIYVS